MIILRKVAEQQKNQRALKLKNRILKQTHDVRLAESLSPITKKLDDVSKSTQESLSPLTKKLDTINESVKESNSKNNKETIVTTSILLRDTFNSLSEAHKSLKLNQEKDGNMNNLGVSIKSLGGDKIQVQDKIYEFTPEIHKDLSHSSYTGKFRKNKNDRRTLFNFFNRCWI